MDTRFPYGFGTWEGLWPPNGIGYPFKTGRVSRPVPLSTPKVENRFYNGKKQQIRRKHSTVRELLTIGAVRVDHIRSEQNLADPLTKGLPREKVQNTAKGMGLMPTEPRTTSDGNPTQ
ncbi:unnamed protein product [Linum trigynum]|uniref:Uncharacterized protein n=1 Tax=Linum trigynum TaxID=586398 RepID=A0AAV2ERR1_9ROSI